MLIENWCNYLQVESKYNLILTNFYRKQIIFLSSFKPDCTLLFKIKVFNPLGIINSVDNKIYWTCQIHVLFITYYKGGKPFQ